MRQWNAELVEYERMKAHYKLLGKENMPKSFDKFEVIKYNKNNKEITLLKESKLSYILKMQYYLL